MSVVATTTFANTKEDGDVVVRTDAMWENWFVSGGVGTSIYAGDSDRHGSIGGRFAPTFEISAGKWFTPYIGGRVQYSGLSFRGFTNMKDNVFVTGDKDSKGLYKQKWRYMYFHFDAMLNLSNFMRGYKEDRFYSFIPYAGAGWIRVPKTTDDAFTMNVGLYNSFRVNRRLDLFLDLRGVMVGEDTIDGEVCGDFGVEGIFTTTVGINVKLGKQGWKRPIQPRVIDGYKSTISAKESDVKRYKTQLAKSKKENAKLKSGVKAQPMKSDEAKCCQCCQTSATVKIPNVVITFELNRSELSNIAKVNLSNIAKTLNKYPSSEKHIIAGYADNTTGNEKSNYELSKARAKVVFDYLTEKCYVDPSCLVIEPRGGIDNMFYNDSSLSRVVIIE